MGAIGLVVAIGSVANVYAMLRGVELSRGTAWLYYLTLSYVVAWWIEADRKSRGIPAPFEYGAFAFFVWPLLAPYYLIQSRGWRGLAVAAGLLVFCSLPDIAALLLDRFLFG